MALIRPHMLKNLGSLRLFYDKFHLKQNSNHLSSKSSKHPVSCKVALITGGSVGIGYAFAKSMLQCGLKGVVLGDVREEDGEKAAEEFNETFGEDRAFFLKCDVTKEGELENLFECCMDKYQAIDIVINNAGLLQDKYWSLEIDVNVKGVIHGTLLGFEYMGKHKKGKGGSIVNVASIYGLQQAHGCPVYNGTKGFVIRFTDAMSNEYYEKLTGVKVFTICPGVTDTNMIDESAKYGLQGFGDVGKILSDALAHLPSQPAEACGDCLLKMLCADQNGSIYVIEESECYQVKLPDRHSLRVCDD
ncbi:hypothetical protein Zmor_020636 [Zophobas morio]|nr:hypothetical protein Zmor_020636 [Zophobas morio]